MADTQQLISDYQAEKDLAILSELYSQYTAKVLRVCMHYLKNAHDSEDAVVDIFLELRDKLLIHQVQNFPAWLHRLACNHCLKKLRRKGRVLLTDTFSEQSFVENEGSRDHKDKYLAKLPDLIEQLDDRQRLCIVLFYLHGRSYKEIEAVTKYSAMEVKSGIQNGKIKLKKLLEQHVQGSF